MSKSQYNLTNNFAEYDYSGYSHTHDYKKLTNDSIILTTLLGLGIIIGTGILTGFLGKDNLAFLSMATMFSSISLLILWAVLIFKKHIKNPKLVFFVFTAIEGVLLGGFTTIIGLQFFGDAQISGWSLVSQAVLGTIAIFISCLFLYSRKIIRFEEGSKARRVLHTVILGFGLLYLGNFIITLITGNNLLFASGPIPIIIAGVALIVAALSIIDDFGEVDRAILNQAPEENKWLLSIGLLSGIIWVYVELLRLLVLIAKNR